jgi:hypothetical protein
MKRLLNLQRYSRTVQCRHVVGGFHCDLQPAADFMLQDLGFDDLARHFPERMVHQKVDSSRGASFRFALSRIAELRALGLLPVTTSTAGSEATFWVPFLIDTGSPATFFSKKTIDALEMDLADHIAIEGKQILWQKSTRHFGTINVLGTDFLRHGDLSICYPTGSVHFSIVNIPPARSLTVFGLGKALIIEPTMFNADGLKKAITRELPYSVTCETPDLIIKTPEGHVLDPLDPIHAGIEYSFELPRKLDAEGVNGHRCS